MSEQAVMLTCQAILDRDQGKQSRLVMRSDGQVVANIGPDFVQFWGLPNGQRSGRVKLSRGLFQTVKNCILSHDFRLAISESSDGVIHVQDVSTGRVLVKVKPNTYAENCFGIPQDGRLLFSVTEDHYHGTVQLWSLPDGRPLEKLTYGDPGSYSRVQRLATSPDGRILVIQGEVLGNKRTGELWSLPDGQRLKTFDISSGLLDFYPNGNVQMLGCYLEGTRHRTRRVWQVWKDAGSSAVTFRTKDCSRYALTPNGQFIAVGCVDNFVRCYSTLDGHLEGEAATGGEPIDFSGYSLVGSGVLCIAVSCDGRFLIAGNARGMIVIAKLPDCQLLTSVKAHDSNVHHLAVSSDGQWLVSSAGYGNESIGGVHDDDNAWFEDSKDNSIKLWRLNGLSSHTA